VRKDKIVIVTTILILFGAWSWSWGTDLFVIGEGAAPIDGDINISRDIAILRAKQECIEKVGVGLSRETITDMGFLLDDMIKIQTFGLVKEFEIIHEKTLGNEYRVKIRSHVVSKEQEKRQMQNLFAHRTITVQGEGEGHEYIEKRLMEQLTKGGYFVFDPNSPDWLSDYLVKIRTQIELSQDKVIKTYSASCEIKMVKRANNQISIIKSGPEDNIIFGKTKNRALRSSRSDGFRKKICEPLVGSFTEALNKKARVKEHDVNIVVQNIPDHKLFRNDFMRMLRSLRLGIKTVSNEAFSENIGQATVSYAEKTDYLAAMIGFRSHYKIKAVKWDRIEVEYTGS